MRGTLQALAFCHNRSVAHGSMGSGSVLLSTYDDRRANDLIVKLDNFGFGRAHYACSLDLKGGALLYLTYQAKQHVLRICHTRVVNLCAHLMHFARELKLEQILGMICLWLAIRSCFAVKQFMREHFSAVACTTSCCIQ